MVSGVLLETAKEGVDEALKHAGKLAGLLDHGAGAFEGRSTKTLADPLGDIELGPKLSTGAFAVAEELDEVGCAVALGAFGNIGGNGKRRALHLLTEREVLRLREGDVDFDGERATTLPHVQVFKCLDFTHFCSCISTDH